MGDINQQIDSDAALFFICCLLSILCASLDSIQVG